MKRRIDKYKVYSWVIFYLFEAPLNDTFVLVTLGYRLRWEVMIGSEKYIFTEHLCSLINLFLVTSH